jgi:hypothetical protein
VPPTSPAQQRYIFQQARKGAAWAIKYIEDAKTMQVVHKGQKMPPPKRRYDRSKAKLIAEGKRARGSVESSLRSTMTSRR